MALGAVPAAAQGSGQLHTAPGLKVHVDLVSVVSSVLTAGGKPVTDLSRDDFQILQDGRPQKISLFQRQTQMPLDLALMIDTSLSTYGDMKFEREAAERFVERVLRPGDRMAVFSFAYHVKQLTPFTGDRKALDNALRHLREGTGTSLFDAIYLGAHALEGLPPNRRRVLLLVTDAGETTSRASYSQAQAAAVRSGAMVYTVLVRMLESANLSNTAGVHAIDTIIGYTGGALYPVHALNQFDSTFDRINEELRTEYLLGYYPRPAPAPGSYHRIAVRLRGSAARYELRFRKEYYTPETSH